MRLIDVPVIDTFIRTCSDGWSLGYHERNGGNLTYRLKKEEVDACRPFFKATAGEWVPIGVSSENLSGEYFIATGSGKFFRNMAIAPADNLCIVQINEAADSYRIVWGLEKGGRPTSELPTHLMNHAVRWEATKGDCRVIYHAHTPSVIALTYVLPLNAKDITRVLWQSATECPVVFPGGVGVVPWMVPGGADIALATCKQMKTFDAAIWAHHGTFCSGPDFDTTFGLMHTIEKAADIYIRAMSIGHGIRQTISNDNLMDIAKAFGVVLREEFLED